MEVKQMKKLQKNHGEWDPKMEQVGNWKYKTKLSKFFKMLNNRYLPCALLNLVWKFNNLFTN